MIRDAWYIVNSVKQDLGIDTNQFDLKFLKWTLDIFKEMASANVIRNGSFKTVRLPVFHDTTTGQRRAELPSDFLDYYKIAICYCGYIINLDANDLICIAPPKLDCCGEALQNEIDGCVQSWRAAGIQFNSGGNFPGAFSYDQIWNFFPYFKNGQFVAGMYGRGEGGYRAGYRIDYENMQIVFDKYLKHDEVILEYKSDGITETGNVIIPAGTEGTVSYGVHWKRCMFSRDQKEHGDSDMFRRRYQRGIKQCIARIQAMTIVEIIDIYRASIMQIPKR